MTVELWLLGGAAAVLLFVEVAFRLELRRRGIPFVPPKTHRDLYIVPHPYLPYVYRAGTVIANQEIASFPLHRGRYELRPVRVSNVRSLGEDVQREKHPSVTRVMCLGGSTTASSIWEIGDPREHSYPLWLARVLAERAPDQAFEVLNCGMGGWTSAEILINFALHLIDLRPDTVILYQGFNDLEASLTRPFASDYSHSRRNFGQAYSRVRLSSLLPVPRGWWSLAYLKGRLVGFGNVRYDILSSIRVGRPDLDSPFLGLATERRNVEHVIALCKANGIDVILSTFAYHLYAAVATDRRHLKYRDGVRLENEMMREVAERHSLPLVDIAGTIPDQDAHFLDTVHFTPDGMHFLAESFAAVVMRLAAARRSAAAR